TSGDAVLCFDGIGSRGLVKQFGVFRNEGRGIRAGEPPELVIGRVSADVRGGLSVGVRRVTTALSNGRRRHHRLGGLVKYFDDRARGNASRIGIDSDHGIESCLTFGVYGALMIRQDRIRRDWQSVV